jgi:rifampicin phosphotransferase
VSLPSIEVPITPLDSALHPRLRRYSDANFAEVAPTRLSPLTWSVLGPPVEHAFRDLYLAVAPALRSVLATSRFAFVGYFGCKPYHNIDGLLSVVPFVPGLYADDVATTYLGGLPVKEPSWSQPRGEQVRCVTRSLRRLRAVPAKVNAAEACVAEIEDNLSATRLEPPAAHHIKRALSLAWSAHIDVTSFAALLVAWSSRVGDRSLGEDWTSFRGHFLAPDDIVWTSARVVPGVAEMEFLNHPFYEIGNDDPEWCELVEVSTAVVAHGERKEVDANREEINRDVLEAQMTPFSRSALRVLAHQASRLLEDRERTKSLAMRALHMTRLLAARTGTDVHGPGWAGCTLDELAHGSRAGRARLGRIREAVAHPWPSAFEAIPAGPQPSGEIGIAPERPASKPMSVAASTPVSGTAFHPGEHPPERGILVARELDATRVAEIMAAVAVICERGSYLSHVAIICRSLGIPAVVGVPEATIRFPAGTALSVDGASGRIVVEADNWRPHGA